MGSSNRATPIADLQRICAGFARFDRPPRVPVLTVWTGKNRDQTQMPLVFKNGYQFSQSPVSKPVILIVSESMKRREACLLFFQVNRPSFDRNVAGRKIGRINRP